METSPAPGLGVVREGAQDCWGRDEAATFTPGPTSSAAHSQRRRSNPIASLELNNTSM